MIPINLSTGTRTGQRKSQRQKYEDKINTWKATIPGADSIEFCLIDESGLLAELARPEQRGRTWFWWRSPSLDAEWLGHFFGAQSIVAGPRYRPDLQVDLPIADDLKAIGLSNATIAEFDVLHRTLTNASERLGVIELEELIEAWDHVKSNAEHVVSILRRHPSFATIISDFDSIAQPTKECLEAISAVERAIRAHKPDKQLGRPQQVSAEQQIHYRQYQLQRLRSALLALQSWFERPAIQAASRRLYFLTGPAGSGKTHLFLDAVRLALAEGRPALVLFGSQFRSDNLWTSICDQLNLPSVGRDVLLGALDSAAEASSLSENRFVILIDAVNDTPFNGFWETQLPVLRAAIAQFPHLALAVSCRDTYAEVVAPAVERSSFICQEHPGFAGQEAEAARKYFSHYGLPEPQVPLLVPEFTVPLFLQMYCESLEGHIGDSMFLGHQGRLQIFERYLDSKVERVARSAAFPSSTANLSLQRNRGRIQQVIDALIDGMVESQSEWLTVTQVVALAAAVLGQNIDRAESVIGALENEGVLIREPNHRHHGHENSAMRLAFQAFSDFLVLRRYVDRLEDAERLPALSEWLKTDASQGVLEAAAIMLPEHLGIELPDLLGTAAEPASRPDKVDVNAHYDVSSDDAGFLARQAWQAFAEMLPYRSTTSIRQRTVDLLLDAATSVLADWDFVRILYMTAPHPGNLLNADLLHRLLLRHRMPDRDASFGVTVYWSFGDHRSPIDRMARWAASGPYPSYPDEVIELSAVSLIWLLSSPNRYLRDWVTKALVQLLYSRLAILRRLFERFWEIDDPYVVQRVVLIAYGGIMRGGKDDPAAATQLAKSVGERAFSRPMRPDELMLDAARGIVEWAAAHKLVDSDMLKASQRPYGFRPPKHPPTMETIDRRFRAEQHQDPDTSFGTVYSSIFNMGDFGRYVIDSQMAHLSRHPLGRQAPVQVSKPTRLIKKRAREFMRSLSRDQLSTLHEVAETRAVDLWVATWWLGGLDPHLALTSEQQALRRACWTSPRQKDDEQYPTDRARRWVFMRTLGLGWTPDRFAAEDRMITMRDRSRSEHKVERWGKKYQWMAQHELLARLIDNYQFRGDDDTTQAYDGLQLLLAVRDLDPSLPPINVAAVGNQDAPYGDAPYGQTWRPSRIVPLLQLGSEINFVQYRGDLALFLANRSPDQEVVNFGTKTDHRSRPWIALAGYHLQKEHVHDPETSRLEQHTWLRSFLLPTSEAVGITRALMKQWQHQRLDPARPEHVDSCYAYELDWSSRRCPHRSEESWVDQTTGSVWEIIAPTEEYRWEGNLLDCSISHTVSLILPAPALTSGHDLHMSIDGPSWISATGEPVATYIDYGDDIGHALFTNLDWILQALSRGQRALTILAQVERRMFDAKRTYKLPYDTVWSSMVIQSDGKILSSADAVRSEAGAY